MDKLDAYSWVGLRSSVLGQNSSPERCINQAGNHNTIFTFILHSLQALHYVNSFENFETHQLSIPFSKSECFLGVMISGIVKDSLCQRP